MTYVVPAHWPLYFTARKIPYTPYTPGPIHQHKWCRITTIGQDNITMSAREARIICIQCGEEKQ